MSSRHVLKVAHEYFAALHDGSKTFEVRRNDRGYQRGDTLRLYDLGEDGKNCPPNCGHPYCTKAPYLDRAVTFVYSGDPRFGGIEPGFVVLALGAVKGRRVGEGS
jgi:hypothetical protein